MTCSLPPFIAIAACDPVGIMGNEGNLPWHCPEDLSHFQTQVTGHVILMGRKTAETLPSFYWKTTTPIVFSRNIETLSTKKWASATILSSPEDLPLFYQSHPHLKDKKNFIIGGTTLFQFFFQKQWIHSTLISHMHHCYEGDTYFPTDFLTSFDPVSIVPYSTFTLIESQKKQQIAF